MLKNREESPVYSYDNFQYPLRELSDIGRNCIFAAPPVDWGIRHYIGAIFHIEYVIRNMAYFIMLSLFQSV
jgi:hypothetical protein